MATEYLVQMPSSKGDFALQPHAANADQNRMRAGQIMVLGIASAVVLVAYFRWIAARLAHGPGRVAYGRNMLLLVVPIALASVAVGLAFMSLGTGAGFAIVGTQLGRIAGNVVRLVRWWRRRRPVRPEDRQRRFEERAARRRARTPVT